MSIPYVYELTHLPSGKVYVGSKYSRDADPTMFWKTYFTSSETVRRMVARDGVDCWEYCVTPLPSTPVAEVLVIEHARIAEALSRYGKDAVINKFHAKNGKPTFFAQPHSPETRVKMSASAHKLWASKEWLDGQAARQQQRAATRLISDQYRSKKVWPPSPLKGVAKSVETRAKMSLAQRSVTDRPWTKGVKKLELFRFMNIDTGEAVEMNVFSFSAFSGLDSQEVYNLTSGRVRRSKRWGVCIGGQWSHEVARLPNPTNLMRRRCPHCGIETSLGNFARWHGDKCKLIKMPVVSQQLPSSEATAVHLQAL